MTRSKRKPKPKTRIRKTKLTRIQKVELAKKLRDKAKQKNLKKDGVHHNKVKKGRWKQGIFWSKKNNKEFIFRSAYEFGYFHILEADTNVVSYIVEPFKIPYKFKGVNRNYIPDIMVLYRDGGIKILEIKPASMVGYPQVQAKAKAARVFMRKHIKNGKYEFITEDDIFASDKDYKALLKLMKS